MKTFHNLSGICIKEGCRKSDGTLVPGSLEDHVVLFNQKLFTPQQVLDMDSYELEEMIACGLVVLVPKDVAENLADK